MSLGGIEKCPILSKRLCMCMPDQIVIYYFVGVLGFEL